MPLILALCVAYHDICFLTKLDEKFMLLQFICHSYDVISVFVKMLSTHLAGKFEQHYLKSAFWLKIM